MFYKTVILGAGLAAILASPVLADEYCTAAPASSWKPIQAITAEAIKLGYEVTRVERDGTCYEVEGYDRNGAKIDILYNPETGLPQRRR